MDRTGELKKFLDSKVAEFNQPFFIKEDPVSIPHLFTKKQDIEIAGFFAAVFAWGIRKTIISKSRELFERMDFAPYDFCMNHQPRDLQKLERFCHRTFNDTDMLYFISFFNFHYSHHHSLESAFFNKQTLGAHVQEPVESALNYFATYFFSLPDVPQRTKKHIASPQKNSGCKRLNMFLRWMVRSNKEGVDFGIWKKIKPANLICPVDVHVARVSTKLHLLKRPQADWKAAMELTTQLRKFDPVDPVKYDFALFGLGALEKF
jgi:uncharacterized protein (TIGR02757 family)